MYFNTIYKVLVTVLVTLIFSNSASAQSEWHWVHPYPTGSEIHGVHFPDDDHGWIVTEAGEIFCTENGGMTWSEQLHEIYALTGVFFLNPLEGWVCGMSNRLLHTTDGGENWLITFLPSFNFTAIEFVNDQYGTVVGLDGAIYRTMNGGETWVPQGSGVTCTINDVSFVDPATGWATAETGNLLHTTTSGAFWEVQETGTSAMYQSVHFLDELSGFAVGFGNLVGTVDGGENWSEVFYSPGDVLRSIDFSGSTGAVCGNGVIVTLDQGANWQVEDLPSLPAGCADFNLNSVSIPSPGRLFAAGAYGLMYIREETGDWVQITNHVAAGNMNSIARIDPNNILACGDGGTILVSQDNGVTWTTVELGSNLLLQDICFTEDGSGYCVGYDVTGNGYIFKSVNGGMNWNDISPQDQPEFYSIDFMDGSTGVVVGADGRILFTTDAGNSWSEKTGFGPLTLKRVRFSDTDRGWIVGNSGQIICFDFSSDSWGVQQSPGTSPQDITSVFPLDSNRAWAVTLQGAIYRTTNGVTWLLVSTSTESLTDVWFADDGLTGYFAPTSGSSFCSTTNGGYTLDVSPAYARENILRALCFQDVDNGWGCGDQGTILLFGDEPMGIPDESGPEGSTPLIDICASPNPFRIATTVSFSLPAAANVDVHLYDLTGRRRAELHSGDLGAGQHSLSVEGEHLPSGIYFVRVFAGDVSESRSIIRIP